MAELVEDRLGLRLHQSDNTIFGAYACRRTSSGKIAPRLEDLESALEALNEYRDRPVGYLRLAIAPAAGHVLGPILVRFAAHHPDIKIELSVDDGPLDIVSGHFDAGIQLNGYVAITWRLCLSAQRCGASSSVRQPTSASTHHRKRRRSCRNTSAFGPKLRRKN